jgi:alpha-1,6-mannosyltransferase
VKVLDVEPGGDPRTVRRGVAPVSVRSAGLVGTIGSLCILLGVAQPGSPFVVHAPGAWFFGMPGPSPSAGGGGTARFVGVMLVYSGIILMLGAWFELVRALRRQSTVSPSKLVAILVAWTVPVLVMPPLFSRDVYSYAAQGQMVTRGINPYLHGPSALGNGPFLRLVDPVWRHAPAPYGPAWEHLSGWIVALAGHDPRASVIGFRLAAVVGVGLMVWGVPALAESVGRNRSVALALGVLNPLVLLVLVGGAHNDALMLGLLVAGCALARRGQVLAGLLFCALAAEVKVPALIGAAFIGWWWGDSGSNWVRRVPRVVAAVAVAAGAMAAISAVAGLGWRWLDGLSNPGVVVSWLDPATAVGLALGHLAGAAGYGGHTAGFVQSARSAGLVLAAVLSFGLILRWRRVGEVQALGFSLLAFVVLGPVVWPWYETWGFVFLAVVAEGWTLRLLLILSAVGCFADVPGTRFLGAPDPVVTVVAWAVLVGAVAAYVMVRLAPSLAGSIDRVDRIGAPATDRR